MEITPFATEHFFAKYEFNTPYQLCNSDCETITVAELLALAGTPLADLGELALGYTESQGNPELRAALAEGYAAAGADDVVMLGTPIEGIYLAGRALLDPGDEVIVLTPAYDALVNLFAHVAGPAQVHEWAIQPTATGWRLDLAALRRLITPRTRLLVLNFPHNPTGFLPTTAELSELARLAEAHDLWLFCDEMYHGLVLNGTPPLPSAADLTSRAVVLSGLSKTYGLPGLRAGWLVVQDAAMRANIMNWKFYTSICPPAPSEFLALAAWKARAELRRRSVAQIEANLVLAESFFGRWPRLFTWRRPLAGSIALVDVHVPSVTALAERLAAAGVLIQPATMLGGSDRQMRLGFGRAGFAAALAQFEAFLVREGVD